jgi:hypothetical protein
MKAYKVFNSDWTCRGFKYEVGKTYSIKEQPVMCERGFHACKKVADCFNYYSFNPENKVAEVELSGNVLGENEDKQCASKITIIKELSWGEMLLLANIGNGNTGHSNSGNWNSGDWNSGHRNSGDRNSGDRNSGRWNSGDRNSGHRNSGDWNSGHRNSGDWNSGDQNTGYFNSITPDNILVFNKKCKRQKWEEAEKPYFINNILTTEWISWSDMTDEEKKADPNAFVREGYLKTYSYKEAWQNAYKEASKEDIKLLKALPNFNADVFFEITGIKID